jgi:hypothetical protein
MDRIPLNWELLKNPINWIILLLMVWIAGLALSLIFHRQFLPTPTSPTGE